MSGAKKSRKKYPKEPVLENGTRKVIRLFQRVQRGRLRKKVVSVQEIPADLRNSNEENVPDISELFSKIALNLKNINQLLSELASDFESIGTYLNHSDDSSEKKISGDNPGD